MVGKTRSKDLRLAFQPPERSGMDDAVTVALKIASVRVGWFRKSAASQTPWTKRNSVQHSLENKLFRQLSGDLVHRPANRRPLGGRSQGLKNLLRLLWIGCQFQLR